jgi:NAD(P)-dependent dehydrogenase (short-subunit alcohol dehydrogenase family)
MTASQPARGGLGAVVVTGASTGIGRATTEHLASLGYKVFAGVRNATDFEALRAVAPNIEPVMLDIRDEGQLQALVALVDESEPGGLRALVNNAGVGVVGPTEVLDIEDWRWVLEVNVVGTVAVTQALLPSLLRGKGRVINIASAAGRVAFPLFGPYVASKFAMEGVSDVLRREVEPHGVKVICIEPGVVRSAMYDKGLPASYGRTDNMTPEQHRRYDTLLHSAHTSAEDARDNGTLPDAVAPTIAKAIAAKRPKTRYATGWDGRTAVICARILPDRMIDFIIRRLTR